MTDYVISTYVSNTSGDGQDLTSSGDTLLVTNAGSLIETDGDDGINASGDNQAITLDGSVYGIYTNLPGSGFGVEISGKSTQLFVNGQAQGSDGVQVSGSDDFITVGSQGEVNGMSSGVVISGSWAIEPLMGNDSIVNSGDIIGGGFGVYCDDTLGGNSIENSGTVSGSTGVSLQVEQAQDSVENSGLIKGTAIGIESAGVSGQGSGAGVSISNSGVISDAATNATATTNPEGALYFDDGSGVPDTIDNSGTISGSGYSIQSYSDSLDIANSGTIQGGLWMQGGGYANIYNSGLWQGDASGDGIALGSSEDILTNSGAINAAISMVSGSDQLTNSGGITGTVTFSVASGDTDTGDDALTNSASGLIAGAVDLQGANDQVANGGKIDGGIEMASGGDTLTNSGTINGPPNSALPYLGAVIFELVGSSSGGDSLTNSGKINGAVGLDSNAYSTDQLTNGGAETLINAATGAITGAVGFGIAGSTLQNSGTIDGAISMVAGADDVVNSGKIGGSVQISGGGGGGGDQFTNSGSINQGLTMGTGAKEVLANTSAATIAGAVSLGGASAKLTNGGKIDGSVTTGSSATLNNAGSIIGLVTLAEGSDTVANSGAISGSVMFTATAQGGDQLKNTGSISQGVVMGSGAGELLVNASGASIGERLSSGGSTATVYSVLFVGASGVLRNGGKIDGDVGMDFKSSKLTNTGSINGAVTLGADGVLTNAGSIVGAVSLTVGDGALTNSGSITGAISIFGADVNSVETNTGTIVGSVTVSGSGYTFNNHNQIYGDVTFGSGDTLTNTGVIHGNLILNNADTVNTSRGLVTGTIMADHDDNQMFIFSGGFGHETIDGFSAGSATTHDTLQFAADDFGSYADVQAAMTQVGKDVLIKLDAADTIVLDGVTIGTKPGDLTAADFKFV